MHSPDLSAEASARAGGDLSPDERRREIAAIPAQDALRLHKRSPSVSAWNRLDCLHQAG